MASAIEKALQGVKLTEQQKKQLARMPPNARLEAIAKLRKSQQAAGLIAAPTLTPVLQARVDRTQRVDSKPVKKSSTSTSSSSSGGKRSIFSRRKKLEQRAKVKEAEGIAPQILLRATLDISERRNMFEEFCKLNYCEENLEFYVEVMEFNQQVLKLSGAGSTDDAAVVAIADRIVNRFLEPGSEREVNIDYALRERTIMRAKQPPFSTDTFAQSATMVFKLMEHDTFAKYLLSDLWQQHKATLAAMGHTHAAIMDCKKYGDDAVTEVATEVDTNTAQSGEDISEANLSDEEGD